MKNSDSLPDLSPSTINTMRNIDDGHSDLLDLMGIREAYDMYQNAENEIVQAGKAAGLNMELLRAPWNQDVITAIAMVYPERTPDNARMRLWLNQPDDAEDNYSDDGEMDGLDSAPFKTEIDSNWETGEISVSIRPLTLTEREELFQAAIDSLGGRKDEDPRIIAWDLLVAARKRRIDVALDTLMEIAQQMSTDGTIVIEFER